MKLLLDENLSRKLIPFLQHDYPESTQVALIGLESAPDRVIWETARTQGFVIVTKDADFQELSIVLGQPPKIIWLKSRNQSRVATLKTLLDYRPQIEEALLVQNQSCVELSWTSR